MRFENSWCNRVTGLVAGLCLLFPPWFDRIASAQDILTSRQQIVIALDRLHEAASRSDFEAYFSLYTDDAIFMGTDATERWTMEEFKGYARPRFNAGKGWSYSATRRDVFIATDGQTAWFDEVLENENLGLCRGTGVLLNVDGRWKIAQYNLSVPIPNALVRSVVETIKGADR